MTLTVIGFLQFFTFLITSPIILKPEFSKLFYITLESSQINVHDILFLSSYIKESGSRIETARVSLSKYFLSNSSSPCNKELFRNDPTIILFKSINLSNVIEFLGQISLEFQRCQNKNVGQRWEPIIFATWVGNSSQTVNNPTFLEIGKNLRFDSNVYLIVQEESNPVKNNGFILNEIFVVRNKLRFQRVQFHPTLETITDQVRRYNLKGDVIKPLIFNDGQFRYETNIKPALETISTIAWLANFSLNIVEGTGWIRIGKDGSLEGMGKQLDSEEGDIVVQTSDLLEERRAQLEFIFPLLANREIAFFRQPSLFYNSVTLKPYSAKLWLAIAISFIIFWICGLIIIHLSPNYTQSTCYNRLLSILGDSTLWIVGLFAQQGWNWQNNPSSLSLKLISAGGFMLTSFLYNLYSGSILSMIAAQEPPIKSFGQLSERGIEIFGDAVNHFYFSHEPKKSMSTHEGLQKILKTKSAFISFRSVMFQRAMLENISIDILCDSISQVPLDSKGLPRFGGMFMKKYSPFRKMFLHFQMRMKEVGIIDRQTAYYFRVNSPPCRRKTGIIESLTMEVFSPVFSFAIVFIPVVLLILVLEIKFSGNED